MSIDNISHDNDDVARLFREHDDIGCDSSLWLRPLRQLFKGGKPIGPVVALTVSPMKQLKLPFGMLTQTENNRLIFWPIMPSGVNMICAGKTADVLDHITLEFPSEKIHMTAYDTNGQPIHYSRVWRTHHFSDCDLVFWFNLLVRVSTLRQQDMAVQRRVEMPTTDKERRTNEFLRYTQKLCITNISLPPSEEEYDYIYFGLYLASDFITTDQFSSSIRRVGFSMDSEIEGWSDGNVFQIAATPLRIGQRIIYITTACPPGRLRSDVSVGFAQNMQDKFV